MVKNREELLQVAQSNASQMKAHLRKAVSNFLNVQRVSPEELAYVLGITNDEMHQILEGNGNITVDALSKLLVATDMAVEIKPVRNTPLGGYGKGMPRSGGYPGPNGIPVDENGRPLPPPPGWPAPGFMGGMPVPPPAGRTRRREERAADNLQEVPMETTGPVRDARGRFVKKTASAAPHRRPATQHPQGVDNPYLGIGTPELVNIIRQNIWDGEIDVNNATHEQLAAFVANKERIMRERTDSQAAPQAERHEEQPTQTPANGGGSALNQFLEMLGNVAEEARNNPQLAETIARFMPRR
jgi:predicted XRE-type DNA-binding protein